MDRKVKITIIAVGVMRGIERRRKRMLIIMIPVMNMVTPYSDQSLSA
jgi:hypothetical protein